MTWIYLSHPLGADTPPFFTNPPVQRQPQATVERDGYSQETITFLNHTGTHLDAPAHFIAGGRTIDQFSPEEWMFKSVLLVDVCAGPDELIDQMPPLAAPGAPDLLLVRTGFQKHRSDPDVWSFHNPGLTPAFATQLLDTYPGVRALGLDTPSASGAQHLAAGAAFHQQWLSGDRLILEDLDLAAVPVGARLARAIALPLRLSKGDGAPCTLIAELTPPAVR